jgi:hypothetical protein
MKGGDAQNEEATDLWTQLEDILHTVRLAEADWRLNDRIDLAVRVFGSQREVA